MHEGGGLARETEIRAARARYRWNQRGTIEKAGWEHVECDREARRRARGPRAQYARGGAV